jgi:hypothetical protein
MTYFLFRVQVPVGEVIKNSSYGRNIKYKRIPLRIPAEPSFLLPSV